MIHPYQHSGFDSHLGMGFQRIKISHPIAVIIIGVSHIRILANHELVLQHILIFKVVRKQADFVDALFNGEIVFVFGNMNDIKNGHIYQVYEKNNLEKSIEN